MSKKVDPNTITAVIYDGNDIVGFLVNPAMVGVKLFDEDHIFGLQRNHDVYLDDDAKQLVRESQFDLEVTDEGKIVPAKMDVNKWKTLMPAIDVEHLKLANEDKYAVVGIPTAFSHKGLLNMLIYGKNVQPYYEMLLGMKKISKKHSSYKGFDMAIIRNINPKYMTPDLVTGKFKLLMRTSYFESQLMSKWYERVRGTTGDLGRQAINAPATAKQTAALKKQLDMITAVNMQSLTTASTVDVSTTLTGKYGPKLTKYFKRFKFEDKDIPKEIHRLMTVLDAKSIEQLEERIEDLM